MDSKFRSQSVASSENHLPCEGRHSQLHRGRPKPALTHVVLVDRRACLRDKNEVIRSGEGSPGFELEQHIEKRLSNWQFPDAVVLHAIRPAPVPLFADQDGLCRYWPAFGR